MLRTEQTTPSRLALIALGLALACGQPTASSDGEAATPDAGPPPTRISQQALLERLDGDAAPLVLDVRTPAEFAKGRVPGAVNVPHDELSGRLGELGASREREIVVYCESGGRAGTAEQTLREAGFTAVRHLDGDMGAWRRADLPCEGCE